MELSILSSGPSPRLHAVTPSLLHDFTILLCNFSITLNMTIDFTLQLCLHSPLFSTPVYPPQQGSPFPDIFEKPTCVTGEAQGCLCRRGDSKRACARSSQGGRGTSVADFVPDTLATLSHIASVFQPCEIFALCTSKLDSSIFP